VAPLLLSFVINGTDGDGDALSWTLSFGDGSENATGADLPVTVEHTYFDAGSFTAVLEVSDGQAAGYANLSVVVSAAQAAPEPKVITGDVDPSCALGFGEVGFTVDAAWIGWAYTLTPADVNVSWWIGEGLSDPIEDGGNSGTVPTGATSGHICYDEAVPFVQVGLPETVTLVMTSA
jgi:hypothetical protein